MTAILVRTDRFIGLVCKWGVIGCLLGLSALLLIAVIVRFIPSIPMSGYDEIVEMLFAWMSFLGALALWRDGTLYRVVFLDFVVSDGWRRALGVFNQILMLIFALVLTFYGYEFLSLAGETTPFLNLDKGYWYAAVPATGVFMTMYSIVGTVRAAQGKATFADGGAVLS